MIPRIKIGDLENQFKDSGLKPETYLSHPESYWMNDIEYLTHPVPDYRIDSGHVIEILKTFDELRSVPFFMMMTCHEEVVYLCQTNPERLAMGPFYSIDDIQKLTIDEVKSLYQQIRSDPFDLCIHSYKNMPELSLKKFDAAISDCKGRIHSFSSFSLREVTYLLLFL